MQNILFFLLCALLTGCHAGTSRPELPEMVEYSGPNASSLRTFIESIEVIKLDHRESITVGAYNAIRSDSNSFYVGDMLNGSNLVYRFDRKGEFLDSIGKIGRAPGEYLGSSDFYSDPETDELYILSGQDVQLYRYHKNGRFIDQREVPDRTQSFIKLGPQFWFYEGYNNGKYPERLTQTDSALQVMGKYLPMETRTLEASIGPLLTQHRNEAYLFTALEPVIYRIIPGSAVPFLKFDFGKYNVPESYWETENAMQAFTDLSQKGFISIAGFMMNDDYIVTELNQQTGMEDSEGYYLLGIKERHNGKWNWIRQRAEENKLIADNQPAPKVSNRPEWYAKKLKGFTQDGKLMIFLSGYELERLTAKDRQLIQNPEILENADPEMDMFLFLCSLK